MTRRILNYGNYGIFLIMGNAGFGPSAVVKAVAVLVVVRLFGFNKGASKRKRQKGTTAT